jgi:hypothetical protein
VVSTSTRGLVQFRTMPLSTYTGSLHTFSPSFRSWRPSPDRSHMFAYRIAFLHAVRHGNWDKK